MNNVEFIDEHFSGSIIVRDNEYVGLVLLCFHNGVLYNHTDMENKDFGPDVVKEAKEYLHEKKCHISSKHILEDTTGKVSICLNKIIDEENIYPYIQWMYKISRNDDDCSVYECENETSCSFDDEFYCD